MSGADLGHELGFYLVNLEAIGARCHCGDATKKGTGAGEICIAGAEGAGSTFASYNGNGGEVVVVGSSLKRRRRKASGGLKTMLVTAMPSWGLHRGVGAMATFAGTGAGICRGERRSHESGLHYALNSCRD
jgi:hypothetical protein